MTDRRAAIEAAFSEAEAGDGVAEGSAGNDAAAGGDVSAVSDSGTAGRSAVPGDAGSTAGSDDSGGAADSGGRARDGNGRFVAKGKDPKEAPPAPAETAKVAAPLLTGAKVLDPLQTPPPPLDAPKSWKAIHKERWGGIPREAQEAILQREKEVEQGVGTAVQNKQFREQFNEVVRPYEHLIRAQGSDPLRAASNLFQTAAVLQSGTPKAKAELVARLIDGYSINVEDVSAFLSGAPNAAQPQAMDPSTIAQQVEQRILGQFQQQRQQMVQQKASAEIAAMEQDSTNFEFFNDLREQMGFLIMAKAQQGKELSPKDAYALACRMDDGISGILQQREKAKQSVNAQASTQKAKLAASSVKSTPASGVTSGQPEGRRAQIEAAWAAAEGR